MATSMVQVRIDDEIKTKAAAIYDELGMDFSTAVRLFLKRSFLVTGNIKHFPVKSYVVTPAKMPDIISTE